MTDQKIMHAKTLDAEELDKYLFKLKCNHKTLKDLKVGDYFVVINDPSIYYCTKVNKCIHYKSIDKNVDRLVKTTDQYNYFLFDVEKEPKLCGRAFCGNRNFIPCAVANNHFVVRIEY